MTNTALRAKLLNVSGTYLAMTEAEHRSQSIKGHRKSVIYGNYPYDSTHMVFADEEQERFYYEKLKQFLYQNCYSKTLAYILEILENTKKYFSQICDSKTKYMKTECLQKGWQRSSIVRTVKIVCNFYTNGTPNVNNDRHKKEQIAECRGIP